MAEDIQVEEVQEEKKKLKGGRGRTRNFATIVYEESAPENWRSILEDSHVPAFISPYHDRDVLPTGESKKPHWHVMIMYDNVKTVEQASELFKSFGGVGCEMLNTVRGYARYLCHLDSPDKVKYSIDDIICLSGSDYFSVINLPSDKNRVLREMRSFCVANNVVTFATLYDYACDYRPEWFTALNENCAYVMDRYLKSLHFRNTTRPKENLVVDLQTGELINVDRDTGEVLDPKPEDPPNQNGGDTDV